MADEWGDEDGDEWGDDGGDGDEWGDAGDGDDWGGDPNADGLGDDAIDVDDWRINVENKFYTAEGRRREEPKEALADFLECIKIEEAEGGDEIFKRFDSLSHCVLLQYTLKENDAMVESYKKLLSYADKVTPNDLNTAIRKILDRIQESSDGKSLSAMYSMTLNYFKSKPGKERVWFDFAMRLCKTYLQHKDFVKCEETLEELHRSCRKPNGDDDTSKGSDLLQIYAIRIQIMAAQKNRIGLNELFEKTSKLGADVHDDQSMSVIRECWGKMYASMNQWDEACGHFFDAFRAYSRVGHENTKQCLKYVVIASMLAKNAPNPFASQDAGVYRDNPAITPISNLLDAFENDNIKNFETVLIQNRASILMDDFIKEHMGAVKLRLRSRVLVKLIKPYKRVKLKWLCTQLNATMNEVENLVVNLILDGSIGGKVDQINMLLDLTYYDASTDKLYGAVDTWMHSIKRLQNTLSNKSQRVDQAGAGRGAGLGFGMGMGGYGMMYGGGFDFDDDDFGGAFGMPGFGGFGGFHDIGDF